MSNSFDIPFGLDCEKAKRNLEIHVLWQLARLREMYPGALEKSEGADYLNLPLRLLVEVCWENEEALRRNASTVVS